MDNPDFGLMIHSVSLHVSSHGTKLKAWLAVVTGKLKVSDYFLIPVDSGSDSDLFSFFLSCRSWKVVGIASGFRHWIRRSWKELPKQGRGGSCLPGDRGRAAAGRSQVWRPQAPPGCLIYHPSGSDAWVAGTPNLLVLFLKWPLSTLTFENYAIRNISPQDCTYLNNISWQ